MKKLEILQKLPKFVTQGHEVSKYCWKNGADRFACLRIITDLQFVENAVSAKCSNAVYSKMRCACL